MADSIRVGLVGYGFAGKTFHAPLIAGTPGLELAAISSSDAHKVLADWPGMTVVGEPGQLFSDPSIDLVVIPTPNITHYPLAKQALLAGKHVVVDKPFTVNLQEARELEMLAKQQKRLLSVFHNRRWDSDFLTVKTLLSEGALGDVVQFESHYDRFRLEVRDRWREKVGAGVGSGSILARICSIKLYSFSVSRKVCSLTCAQCAQILKPPTISMRFYTIQTSALFCMAAW